jgi:hypothetical protein
MKNSKKIFGSMIIIIALITNGCTPFNTVRPSKNITLEERFVTEFWRLTPKVLWGWMSMAQILSLIVMAGGMVWGFYRINKFKSLPLKSENEQNK